MQPGNSTCFYGASSAARKGCEPCGSAVEAGEGNHWSSRSERTVVEGAQDSELRCRCRTVKAGKLDSLLDVK
jgi:ferredoxin